MLSKLCACSSVEPWPNVPDVTEAKPSRARTPRWRYVVPNAITCTGLLIGLVSTFMSMEGAYYEAAWLIVLCVLLDKADGTAARLLRATSAIGVQLDSFSDFVTFGIAPGTLVYMALWQDPNSHFVIWQGSVAVWVLRVLVASYVLCACIRLAKFNVLAEESEGDQKCFYGLATTLCGATVSVCYIVGVHYDAWDLLRWLPVACFAMGVLMVSNFPMPKLAPTESKAMNAFIGLNVAVAYVTGILRIWPEYLLAMLGLYLVGGFIWGLRYRESLKPRRLDPYPES